MNKKAKLMLVALSATAITTGAFALAGCAKKGGNNSPTASELYANYVAYAQENNLPVLSEEQWLETIQSNVTIKGDTGATGPTGPQGPAGEQGPQGDKGPAGVSVDSIEWGEKDGVKGLIIKYSNGTEGFVALPKETTHVHAYNDNNVITLIPATETEDGLGYKVCEDKTCNHIEMVILSKRYVITVKDMGNKPVEGAKVTVNGATSTTDKDGVAYVTGYGFKNDYLVFVEKEGFAVAGEVRTGEDPEISVTMGKRFTTVTDSYGNRRDGIVEGGTYTVEVKTGKNSDYDWNSDSYTYTNAVRATEIKLAAGETAKYFKITPNLAYAELKETERGENILKNGEYSVLVLPGEVKTVWFTASLSKLEQLNHNFGETDYEGGDKVTYTVTVEDLALPAEGSEMLPITVNANEEVTLPAGATDWVYYRWVNDNTDIFTAKLTLASGAEAKFSQIVYASSKFTPTEIDVANDTAFEIMSGSASTDKAYTFRVKGGDKFTLVAAPAKGTLENANEITALGEASHTYEFTSGSSDMKAKWFKYTVTDEALFTFSGTTNMTMYKGKPASVSESGTSLNKKQVVKLEAGEYYFKVDSSYAAGVRTCKFSLTAYNAETDAGYGADVPKAITLDTTQTLKSINGTIYFKFTAPSNGKPGIGGSRYVRTTNTKTYREGDEVIIDVSSSAERDFQFTWTEVDLPIEISPVFEGETTLTQFTTPAVTEAKKFTYKFTAPSNGTLGVSGVTCTQDGKKYSEGATVEFSFTVSEQTTFTLSWTKEETPDTPDEGTFTFTVVDSDNAPVSGVTITLMGLDDDFEMTVELTNATTDAEGKVSIKYSELEDNAGEYGIKVSGYDQNIYQYTYNGRAPYAPTNPETSSYKIELSKKAEHTFTVKDASNAAVVNKKVTLMDGDTEVGSGTTDENGVVKLTFFPGYYTVMVDGYTIVGDSYTEPTVKTYSVSVKADVLTEYTFTVAEVTVDSEGVETIVKKFANAKVIATVDGKTFEGVTGADGVAKFNIAVDPTDEYARVSYKVELAEADAADYYQDYEESAYASDGTARTVHVEKKAVYTVTLLSASGAPVANAKVEAQSYDGTAAASATTDSNGVAVLKAPSSTYTIAVVEGVPAGYNAPSVTTEYDAKEASYQIKLVLGDHAATGVAADGFNDGMLGQYVPTCHIGEGLNALTNGTATDRYYFSPSASDTYTFTIGGDTETAYIYYLKVGGTVLINNGKQVAVANGVVLGANRGINKVYEFSLVLSGGADVIIGYATGTEAGGEGYLTVKNSAVTVVDGTNEVTLKNGSVKCVYNYDDTYQTKVEWTGEDVTVTVNGATFNNGDYIYGESGNKTIVISSESETEVVLTLTPEDYIEIE